MNNGSYTSHGENTPGTTLSGDLLAEQMIDPYFDLQITLHITPIIIRNNGHQP